VTNSAVALLLFIGIAFVYVFFISLPVMFLWNFVIIDLFAIDKLSYLKTVAMLVLIIIFMRVLKFAWLDEDNYSDK